MNDNNWMPRFTGCLIAVFCIAETAFGQATLVSGGEVRAVVVTAAKPSQVAVYAVEEFVRHVEKATGQRLPVAIETDVPKAFASRIFVGATQAARQHGIDPNRLDIEEFTLRTIGKDFYIVGKELHPDQKFSTSRPHGEPRNPLSSECVHSGTLFGVYDVLERYLGVHWLWPGDLGTYVPRIASITIPKTDETIKPRLLYRDLGGWDLRHIHLAGVMYGKTRKPISGGFTRIPLATRRNLIFPTEEAGHAYGKAMEVFLRRHRRATPIEKPMRVPRNAHQVAGIADWWAAHGAEHPEWFALVNGKRGDVGRTGAYTNLCVSNDELRDFIVNEAWDGGDLLVLGDGDGHNCECAKCMAWDGPQPKLSDVPKMVREKYKRHANGERYARYWNDVFQKAVKKNPKVRVTGYVYGPTLPAPITDIKLDKNIFGEFVIYGGWDGWFPMSREEEQWTREQWLGWSKTGMSLFFRPNYLLGLYVTPNISVRQTGEFFKLAHKNGMVGASFEAYSFSWAVHGPMAYMHHRLLWNPELEINDLRQEYFSAFGPAASQIEEYFDYWEKYASTRPAISEVSSALEKLRRPRGHALAFPPRVYRPAQAILEKALQAARQDPLPEFAQRVKFLQAGLQHALLTTHVYEFLDYDGPEAELGTAPLNDLAKLTQARDAMQELIKFRHDPLNRFVSSYIDNAIVEQYFIRNIEALFKKDSPD
ncbi:MAG: DUF4838 domain-containing protein [Planctomycetaceae bacterium]|nr:DUF4838 domain-containing protein [Planctomycetaceae bacterium]MBT6154484.1 DUF4838 domain-containing protein [Planctomycetaceae bacterium]MBT6486514.1 DUF4838 domain-containing protein [Planctomycetaceae bacterium]MBT6497941.1 DUF4838 domain-containing protein [Planctomycetaceae bacterium]